MDQSRQIRFLIPPFFLLLSITLGLYFHLRSTSTEPLKAILDFYKSRDNVEIFIAFIAIGIGSIALGFFIGTVSTLFLTLMFYLIRIVLSIPFFNRFQILNEWRTIFQGSNYEAVITNDTYEQILAKFTFKDSINLSRRKLYLVATYDHHYLYQHSKGVHEWLLRRWNAFNISFHSVFALILPPVVAPLLWVQAYWGEWLIFIFPIVLVLFINATIAWCQTMRMIAFQSRIDYPNSRPL